MKKLAFVFFLALSGSLFLASCSGSDDDTTTTKPKPSINWKGGGTYTSADGTKPAGSLINFGVNVSSASGEKITKLRVTINVNGTGDLSLFDSTIANSTSLNKDFPNILVGNLPGSKNTYTATVTQSNGEVSSVSFTITTTAAAREVSERLNIQMGGQSNATIGSFFDFTEQDVLLLTQAAANPASVDFIYYSGATNASTFSAPDDTQIGQIFSGVPGWAVKNTTRFRKTSLTPAQFDAITTGTGSTSTVLDQQATIAGTTSKATQLAVGNVIVFVTAGGKDYGLIKVTALTAGGAGSITFDLKFIEE